jgi:hypothetical protein
MRPLKIGPEEQKLIADLKAFAAANPIDARRQCSKGRKTMVEMCMKVRRIEAVARYPGHCDEKAREPFVRVYNNCVDRIALQIRGEKRYAHADLAYGEVENLIQALLDAANAMCDRPDYAKGKKLTVGHAWLPDVVDLGLPPEIS